MIYSSIRDNHSHGTVGDFLKQQIQTDSKISIVSAYFTIYAYKKLKEQFDSIDSLRFLFGEPTFLQAMDPEKINAREFQIEDTNLSIPPDKRLSQKSVARDCQAWLREKAEIRSMVKPNFLHGKLYHILQKSGIEKAIAGSSNFTVHGLGLGGSKNIELNLIIDSDRDREELHDWFDKIWDDQTGLVEDVKEQVLHYLDQLYTENAPDFIYFKTLYHIFEGFLDESRKGGLLNERTGFFDSGIWNSLYDFQKDGVKGAINKVLKHNGCIIADSVGLGKTYEALAVIKYFELLNHRVLVICPKKLSGNWTVYQASQNHALNPFAQDRFSYSVLYHTDMGREKGRSDANGIDLETFNWGAYDLIVIDESHNFRGNPMEKKRDDGSVRMNRALWLMEKVIKSGVKTKVLMLSATPVNNTLKDLRNQMAFITEGNDQALSESSGIHNISQTLQNAQTHFTNWSDPKKNPERSLKKLLEQLDSSFFKLLDELTIARSRRHIQSFYNLEAMGNFPIREKPISVYPDIDIANRFPSYDRLNKQILRYKLSVFNPSAYVKPGCQAKYAAMEGGQNLNFKQIDREHTLIGMMKVNFLKRLESSIEAFEISMDRTIQKIEKLSTRINDYLALGSKKTDESFELDDLPEDEEAESEEQDLWRIGKKLKFDFSDLDLVRWLTDLQSDKDELSDLYNNACSVTQVRDAKLVELKSIIHEKISKPYNQANKKILIFTAFSDTALYLYQALKDWYKAETGLHCALVTGSYTQTTFGRNDYDSILMNFSPLAKNRAQIKAADQSADIDLLIATDCISEGQNLQDCDFLVNYDIHWNPVRIIQRFGRIDRLGSQNESIRLVNFWPTRDLDAYINLKVRVEAKMALVDVTATGEDNILNVEQIQELVSEDLKYRNRQLKQLQEEVLDLEDMDASVSLSDFSLDDFRIELLRFLEENRRRLASAPFGLYAIVPAAEGSEFTQAEKEIIRPGVIFCLRQNSEAKTNTEVNPLAPFFLVYIRQDGMVRYNFTHAKQILEIFRRLCQGKMDPYAELCEIFNKETLEGSQMEAYSELLRKAAGEMVRVHQKRDAQRLVTGGRGALVLPLDFQVKELEQFELITWLIVR